MVGSLLRSHYSASFSTNYVHHLLFSIGNRYRSPFFSAKLPATADDYPGGCVHSRRISSYAGLSNDEQKITRTVDKRRHECGASMCSWFHSSTSQGSLKDSIQAAVEGKNYQKLPDLFATSKEVFRNPNPFLFLSALSEKQKIIVVDEILQSLISIRPRSRPHVVYSCLLSYVLETQSTLPLALAIIQRILRSGCLPVPQTHLLLSKAWVEHRQGSQCVLSILLEMDSIGYPPDCGTCNYLILSLCKIDQFKEAVKVLHGMGQACVPDLDSYGILISEMSELRKTSEVVEMVKEMVDMHGLNLRKETILKALCAMRANRDIWRAAAMIEYLETKGVHIDFEAYELALESCVENHQFVLAGKFAVKMTERRFIPYIKVRQRLVEGLVGIGELELASIVRHRFAELGS